MFEYLEKLRQKSDKHKKRIAFFVALIFSSTILIVWITVVLPDIGKDQNNISKSNTASPISNFTDMLSESVNKMGETFGKIKDAVSSIATSTAYYVSATSTQDTTKYVYVENNKENTGQIEENTIKNESEN